jgi:hypothetical protein
MRHDWDEAWEYGCGLDQQWAITTEGEDGTFVATTPFGAEAELIVFARNNLPALLKIARLSAEAGDTP